MAVAKTFVAAIELGSTKITGIAGTKNPTGSISIWAYAAEDSADCIKRGTIYNIDKAAQCVQSVIHQLEEKLEANIKKVYVGVGGMSVHTVTNTVTERLPEETKISQALVDKMMAKNKSMQFDDYEILSVVSPQEYLTGNSQLTTEPIGILTDRIEAHYMNIVARKSVKGYISQCFSQAGYEIADYFIAPQATANAVLNINEKRIGCALVDMGADTTTVAVYKSGTLKHLAVIPLGGNNITRDITALNFERDDAERMKRRFGKAYVSPEDNQNEQDNAYNLDGKKSVRAGEFNMYVTARVKEIIENVANQIKLSEYSGKLTAGIVLTGGGAQISDIEEAFKTIIQTDAIRVASSSNISLEHATSALKDGTHYTLIGLLNAGKENCRKIEEHEGQTSIFEEIEQEAETKKRQSQYIVLMNEAKQHYNKLEYQLALNKIAEAESLHLAENTEETESLKQQILEEKGIEDERRRKEDEAKQKQADYDRLITEAKQAETKGNYKEALSKAEEAAAIGLEGKEAETSGLIDDIKKKKKDNSSLNKFFNMLTDRVKNGVDELTKE